MATDDSDAAGLNPAESSPSIDDAAPLHAQDESTAETLAPLSSFHSSDDATADPLDAAPPDDMPLHSTDEATEDPMIDQPPAPPAEPEMELHAVDEPTADSAIPAPADEEPPASPEPVEEPDSEDEIEPSPDEKENAVTPTAEAEESALPQPPQSKRGPKEWLKDAVAILRLREDTIRSIATTPLATKVGTGFAVGAGVLGAACGGGAAKVAFTPLGIAIASTLLWGLARLMGSRQSWFEHYRPTSVSAILHWPLAALILIPGHGASIASVIALWLYAVQFKIFETVHGLPRKKAGIVTAIGVLLCCFPLSGVHLSSSSMPMSSPAEIAGMNLQDANPFVDAPVGTTASQGAELRLRFENILTIDDINRIFKEKWNLRKSAADEGPAVNILWFADSPDTGGGTHSNLVLSLGLSADPNSHAAAIASRAESDSVMPVPALGESARGFDLKNSRHEIYFSSADLAVALTLDASGIRMKKQKAIPFERVVDLAKLVHDRITSPPAIEDTVPEMPADTIPMVTPLQDTSVPLASTPKSGIVVEEKPVADGKGKSSPVEGIPVKSATTAEPVPYFVRKSDGKEVHDFTYEPTPRPGSYDDFTSETPRLRKEED